MEEKMVRTSEPLLADEMLHRFAERAPVYDRENRFLEEDFDELKRCGYLLGPIPTEFGGLGPRLPEIMRWQRKLAYYAAPTALAVNMHFYWMGALADAWRAGDNSVQPFLKKGADGEVFAAGHAEPGNDVPIQFSTTRAERVDGGYRIYGKKSFTSLGPAWTILGFHAADNSDPASPMVLHAFVPRDRAGITTIEVWDTLGMRATQSDDTLLDGCFVADEEVLRVVQAGQRGLDFLILCVFAWALTGFGNVYYGSAQRAFDQIVESVQKKKSVALSRSMAYHAEVQHEIAEMAIELEGVGPHLDRVADDWANGVNHGYMWGAKFIAAKYHAVESSWRVVDKGLDVLGGFGIFKAAGYERLWRDARLGRLHPANSALMHEEVAKAVLRINMDERPRWG
jgi:alkylation response protein AidB-like acyl-CoA dehydrogenase